MKRLAILCAAASLALALTPAVNAQSNQLLQGTQLRLSLLNGLSTRVARNGDPFTAVVAEPVFAGALLVLPAGAKVHGEVRNVDRARHFAMFRGQSSMNLVFRSIEVDGRIYPAQMSILAIYSGGADSGRTRKDLNTVEGVVIEQKRDIKSDVEDVAIGTGGGSLVGVVFSHVVRGTVIGLVGSSAYIIAKKGKDLELPTQTGMLVRMDSSVALPRVGTTVGAYNSGGN